MVLTEEDDTMLRGYARRLGGWGEEAYHNAICEMLSRGKAESIRDVRSFFIVAIKYALYKIYRHEVAERKNIEAYLNGDPIPQDKGLRYGRLKHERCKKNLHVLTEENSAYIGVRRTCRQCKRLRERKHKTIQENTMEFTIHYTMDGVGYGKVISGTNEVDARTKFAKELKEHYPASLYVITGIESLKAPGELKQAPARTEHKHEEQQHEEAEQVDQDKTTNQKLNEAEKKGKA